MYGASHKVCSVLEKDLGKGRGKLNSPLDGFAYKCVFIYMFRIIQCIWAVLVSLCFLFRCTSLMCQ